jgi:membrane-associated protein
MPGAVMLSTLLDWLQALPLAGVVAVAGALVFGECTFGLGLIVPGESGLFILGTTATTAPKFLVMWLVTTACAVAGDSAGYLIGSRYGPRVRQWTIVRRHGAQGWDHAAGFLRRRGAVAVLVAIFLPVLRTFMPAVAGASGLPFRTFLPAVLVGAIGWCALHIGVGALAGAAARRIELLIGRGSWILAATVVAIIVVVVVIKRRRATVASRNR